MASLSRGRARSLSLCAIVAILAPGCARSTTEPARPGAVPLRVAAASDLQTALPVLAKRFAELTKIAVSPTFGASGRLADQIKAGAPFDLFLAANQTFVQTLADGGFVRKDSVRPYARGSLVLVVGGGLGEAPQTLNDLTRPEVTKIAIANPVTAPYGAAAKQAIERAGLWKEVAPKIVQAESVRQALQYVESGNAEAGLVGRAIARGAKLRAIDVETRLYHPIIQGLGVVSRSERLEAAETFARFILSDEGQAILADFGFAKAGAGDSAGAP